MDEYRNCIRRVAIRQFANGEVKFLGSKISLECEYSRLLTSEECRKIITAFQEGIETEFANQLLYAFHVVPESIELKQLIRMDEELLTTVVFSLQFVFAEV